MDQDAFIKERVDGQLSYYEQAANQYKRKYIRSQYVIIVFGILIPVIINLPKQALPIENVDMVIQLTITVMSLIVAIVTGLSNFRKWGDLWLSFRMTEEVLKHEKFQYVTGTGEYSDRDMAFDKFVRRIELILSAEHNKFRSLLEDSQRPTTSG